MGIGQFVLAIILFLILLNSIIYRIVKRRNPWHRYDDWDVSTQITDFIVFCAIITVILIAIICFWNVNIIN